LKNQEVVMSDDKFNKDMQDLAQKLVTLGEKANLKMNLAGMEAKKSWENMSDSMRKLADNFRHMKYEAKKDSEEANVDLHLGLMEARDRWGEMLEHLQPLKEELRNAKSGLDHARVQAHLAAMDSKEAIDARMDKLKTAYKDKVAPKVDEVVEKLKEDFESIDKDLSE
jgi:hypothetical protein